MTTPYFLRRFDRTKDRAMIEGWLMDRGLEVSVLNIFPALGVIASRADTLEDCAALWLYMDNSVGVCFPEHAMTRPGLRAGEARDALLAALDFLSSEAARMNYGVMLIHTPAAFARTLSRKGLFVEAGKDKITMIGSTKEKDYGN